MHPTFRRRQARLLRACLWFVASGPEAKSLSRSMWSRCPSAQAHCPRLVTRSGRCGRQRSQGLGLRHSLLRLGGPRGHAKTLSALRFHL